GGQPGSVGAAPSPVTVVPGATETVAPPPATAAPVTAGQTLAGERAVLTEEAPAGGAALPPVEASVQWRVLPDPAGPLIAARIDVPARGMRLELSIQREAGNETVSHSID